jgi:ribosomal protein S9
MMSVLKRWADARRARVRIYPGDGQVVINDKALNDILADPRLGTCARTLKLTDSQDRFNLGCGQGEG